MTASDPRIDTYVFDVKHVTKGVCNCVQAEFQCQLLIYSEVPCA